MADSVPVRAEDLVPVRSRVSWGAIFAGAVLALGVYLVLTLLGSAIGLSIEDKVRAKTLGAGAVVWAIVTTGLALFAGGWVATQLSVGENKAEAVMHGLIVWGVVFATFLWLVSTGVRAGFNAMVGMTQAGSAVTRDMTARDWEAAARRAGVPQDQIDGWKQKAKDAPAAAKQAAEDEDNQRAAAETSAHVAWWTLLGTLLSMAAAVGGALVGAGPTFRLVGISFVSRHTANRSEARRPVGSL